MDKTPVTDTSISSPEHERLSRLLRFLEADPQNAELLLNALLLAAELGELTQGQALLAHAAQHGIDDARIHAHAIPLLLRAGDYAAAADHGERALAGGIQHPVVIFNAAFAAFYCGHYDRADTLLAPLSAQADCDPAALILRARALHHLEHPEEALQLVEQALPQATNRAEALGLQALLRYEDDQNEAALQAAHDALALNPDQLDALLACGGANFELDAVEAARRAYQHAVDVHPTCGRAWSGLGQIAFHDMAFDTAEQQLREAVRHMPDHIGTWHMLAWIYILRGDAEQAREVLQRSYALDRNFGETHGGLAVVDAMEGHEAAARTGIRRALKLAPDGLAARYAEMLLLERAGDKAAATQLVNEVLDRPAPAGKDTGRALVAKRLKAMQQGQTPPQPRDRH